MNKFIKENIYKILLVSVILFSLFLRFYKIDINPPSLTWDEASLGYNAYSILRTGADEYGSKFPLSIRSFEDHKPPAYVYLTIPSIAAFGLNEASVRLPSAILGSLSVIVIYFLVKEIFFGWEGKRKERVAILSAFFLGVSPWHLQFSRAAFEGNIGLFFFLSGFLFFLKSIKSPRLIIGSVIFFSLSAYSYHSFRLIVPVFSLLLIGFFWKEILINKKYYIVSFFIGLFVAIPIITSFFFDGGAGKRLSMVSSLSAADVLTNSIEDIEYDRKNNDSIGPIFHNRRVVYFLTVAKGYFDHWSPDFLFFHGDGGRQHHAVNMGMLYLWELPFILIGVFVLLNKRDKRIILLILMFLIAPASSAVTTGTPHPVRAIAMAPVFSIFTAIGFYFLFFRSKKFLNRILLLISLIFFMLNFSYYIHQYYVHTPITYGDFWQYGYKEAFAYIKPIEKDYNKIVFTYTYDQPYIYYLFYNKIDPSWYQQNWDYLGNGETERMRKIIGKYEFKNIEWEKDTNFQKTLLIASPSEIPEGKGNLLKTIYFPNGDIAFKIIET